MESVYDAPLARFDDRGYAVGFLSKLVALLNVAFNNNRTWGGYWRVMAFAIQLGPVERDFLRLQSLSARIIDMYLGESSPHPELNPRRVDKFGHAVGTRIQGDLTDMLTVLGQLTAGSLQDSDPVVLEMITSPVCIKNFAMEAYSKTRSKTFGHILSQICLDLRQAEVVAAIITTQMAELRHDFLRPLFRVISAILSLEPDQETRVGIFMTKIMTVLEENRAFWKVYDFIVAHLLRIASSNPLVAAWLTAHADNLSSIITWYQTNPLPPQDKKRSFVNGMNRDKDTKVEFPAGLLHLPRTGERYYLYTQTSNFLPVDDSAHDKIEKLQALLAGNCTSMELFDSDDEIEERKFLVEQRYDVMDEQRTWLRGEIKSVNPDGTVGVHYSGFKPKYDENIPINSRRIGTWAKFVTEPPPQ